jgi:hypothetical protein
MRIDLGSLACLAVIALAGSASAQTSPFYNGNFDLTRNGTGGLPGFTNNGDASAQRRTLGDGLTPTAITHTGQNAATIGPINGQSFHGYTTDTRNLLDPNFNFFDVSIDWWGGDALDFSLWYAIPADAATTAMPPAPWPTNVPDGVPPFPEGFGPGGFRLDLKGAGNGLQNIATVDTWAFGFGRQARARDYLFAGTTNGQWRQVTFRWNATEPDGSGWKDLAVANQTVGNYTLPPANSPPGTPGFPNRVKITFGRFNPGNTADNGTIFFDDLSFTQTTTGPTRCNAADIATIGGALTPDGQLTADDIIAYIGAFFANNVAVADLVTVGGNPPPDGVVTADDLIYFLGKFFSPCGS